MQPGVFWCQTCTNWGMDIGSAKASGMQAGIDSTKASGTKMASWWTTSHGKLATAKRGGGPGDPRSQRLIDRGLLRRVPRVRRERRGSQSPRALAVPDRAVAAAVSSGATSGPPHRPQSPCQFLSLQPFSPPSPHQTLHSGGSAAAEGGFPSPQQRTLFGRLRDNG